MPARPRLKTGRDGDLAEALQATGLAEDQHGARTEVDERRTRAGEAARSFRPGYSVVIPPTRLQRGSIDAMTRVPDGDNGDGIVVLVQAHDPLFSNAITGDLHATDINGRQGWTRDAGPGSPISWQVSPSTWAFIGGASTTADALAFARSLAFVDETTWRSLYHVAAPDLLSDAPRQPPPTTIAEPTVLVIDRRTAVTDTPQVAPIGCGNHPFTDNVVDQPLTAAQPDDALQEFLATPQSKSLFDLGYEQISITDTDTYRYERRNNIAELVTVIFVTRAESGWAATRWQASPC
ncbi:MAG: hypothetical protein ABI862_11210 [Ilumatobacteraceae bacterium]